MYSRFLSLLIVILIISGCAETSVNTKPSSDSGESTVNSKSLVMPQIGDEIFVNNNSSNIEVAGKVTEIYLAASGRYCSLYQKTESSSETGQKQYFACLNDGKWIDLPLILTSE